MNEVESLSSVIEPSSARFTCSAEICKHVNTLLDPLPSKRLQALKSIRFIVFEFIRKSEDSGKAEEIQASDLLPLQHLVEEILAKPLLRRFADSSEKCRSLSISILSELLMLRPVCIAVLLPYIIPVISERFPLQIVPSESSLISSQSEYKGIPVEPSEEVRLLLIKLIRILLQESKRLLDPFASDIASILMSAAIENDPVVLVEVCSTIKLFAELMECRLKDVAKNFVLVMLHALSHNRCRVRVAALQAIEIIVLCGAHETLYHLTAYRDPNIIPIREFYNPTVKTQYLALLASDRSILVREALLKAVAHWLLQLPERREHEIRLLPYVLNGLIDENTEMQELAFDMMELIGQQYERENEDEVRDIKQYLIEDIDTVGISDKGFELPTFLKRRPCLGARIMVKRSFSIILQALGADIQAWQLEPKILAAKLLYVVLIFVEENATMHLQSIIIILMKACLDSIVENKIEESAKVLGRFVDPSAFLDILIPRVSGDYYADASIQDKGRGLLVLSWIMQGCRSPSLKRHIPEVCSLLTDQDILTSLQRVVNRSVISIMEVLVESADGTCKEEVVPMLWILLNANAVGTIIKNPCRERVSCCFEKLSVCLGYDSVGAFVAAYTDDIISLLLPPQLWSSHSLDGAICARLLEEENSLVYTTKQKLCDMIELSRGSTAKISLP
ncbi:hypothetical protein KP509_29G045100 [Ceratopteris richardii]|uniref:Uncharacterized protein n=1 Tax=Ceratopteris richardii TaxID=49495 RepID=A0A8T2R876_CERRI|nr:hypothetical protein KP509_29G045100 [Ceratopteris richardii]